MRERRIHILEVNHYIIIGELMYLSQGHDMAHRVGIELESNAQPPGHCAPI